MGWRDYSTRRNTALANQETAAIYGDANAYRAALERAGYNDAARQYGAGADQITNYLAASGPLADSGARTALRSKLYSQVFGGARSSILNSYAEYLRQRQIAQRQFEYQRKLLKYQKDLQQTGFGGFLGGVAGAVGGPFLGALGAGIGTKLGGPSNYGSGGGYY